ncbi:MAG TPA: VWA domain-containing protein [Methylomirabilota bacterium]|nr:VWA domain-containing protein [Methylomirabilota bacterium]
MRLATPGYLWLLVPVLLLVWLELGKRTATVRFSDAAFLRSQQGFSRWLRLVVLALNGAALVLAVVALARPQRGRVFEEIESHGVDIMLCLDVSESMSAVDLRPDRITAAKQRAEEFVSRRSGDRIGVVVFGNGAMTLCPLTLDREVISGVIDRLRIGTLDGTRTAIGMGLADAVARLHKSSAKEKVVILLTDGVNNAGEVEPLTAARLAQTYGIKVYCIGVGSQEPVTVMVNDPFWGQRPQTVQADFDLKTLEGIADLTGGRAYTAGDAEALKRIYDEISRMEPTQFKATHHTVYSEKAGLFLLPAALLFLTGALVPAVLTRRLP